MQLILTENDAGQRLDRFLRKAFKSTPLSLIQKALRKGRVRINGKKRGGSTFLSRGDVMEMPDNLFKTAIVKASSPAGPGFRKMIVYEDENYLAINKPFGIPVQPGTGHKTVHLTALLQAYLGSGRGKSLTYSPAFAHRLDRDTSGVLMAAKNAAAQRTLAALFRQGRVRKTYSAVVKGRLRPARGRIEIPLENKAGKKQHAVSVYRTIRETGGNTLIEVEIHTGRTHQIRRHLAGLGHPVLNDARYGTKGRGRLMLHAREIIFKDPLSRHSIRVPVPVPEVF
jgi:23S rRNA pseudouridine955/2504/2580 synthase